MNSLTAAKMLFIVWMSALSGVIAYIPWAGHRAFRAFTIKRRVPSHLRDVPLELEGQLDPSRKWDVTFRFNGEEKVVSMPEDMSALEMGESIFDGVDSSCRNGVCTTCAGRVAEGIENTVQAVNGLGKPQIEAGFVCTCQCYVTGPGVTIELGKYDEVYESQYGQFEKSYGDLKYANKAPGDATVNAGSSAGQSGGTEKKKGLFGF